MAACNVLLMLACLTTAPARVSAHASASQKITDDETVNDRTRAGTVRTKHAAAKEAKAVAEKGKEGSSKSGAIMTDAWVTTRVKSALEGDDLLKDSDVSVDTARHVVTLGGRVTTLEGRLRAGAIARHTEGVRHVVNRLTVGAKP